MTAEERHARAAKAAREEERWNEYAAMVKALDMACRKVKPALWPLCLPAAQIVQTVEATVKYKCPMCSSMVNNHPCSCPVSSCKKGLRKRERRN